MIWGKKLSNKQHHHSLAIEKTNPKSRQLITLMYAYIYCNDHIKYQQFTSYFLLWYVKWARQILSSPFEREARSGIKSEIQNISDEALLTSLCCLPALSWVKARECMRRSKKKKKKTLASGTSMTNTVTISPSPVLIRLMAQLNVLSLERK